MTSRKIEGGSNDERPRTPCLSSKKSFVTKCGLTRRDFLKVGVAGGAWMALGGLAGEEAEGSPPIDVWVFQGKDEVALTEAAMKVIAEQGAFGSNARSLALKVNAAWARTPEQGANTHPAIVETFLRRSKDLGIREVWVPENPCKPAAQAFTRSGIQGAVERAGGRMIDLGSDLSSYRTVELPQGRSLQRVDVSRYFLEADAVVNMPVAKSHSSATLTIAMKNWMGAVKDRGFWHRNDLHQCIADIATLLRPTWTLVDATRIMFTDGPQGPSQNMKYPHLLILSKDQVAADVYAATLWFEDPVASVRYLALARERAIGETHLERMKIHTIKL